MTAPQADSAGEPELPAQRDPQAVWSVVRGGLSAMTLIAMAQNQQPLALTTEVLVVVGDAAVALARLFR